MGEIRITVQTEKRLAAITELSKAIYEVAKALSQGTHVIVKDCHISSNDIGIKIDTEEQIMETKIEKVD